MEPVRLLAAIWITIAVGFSVWRYLVIKLTLVRFGEFQRMFDMDLEGDRGWGFPVLMDSVASRIYRAVLYVVFFVALVVGLSVADPVLWRMAAVGCVLYVAWMAMRFLGPFSVFVGVDAHRVVVVKLSWFTWRPRGVVLDELSAGAWWELDMSLFRRTLTYHSATGRSLSFTINRKFQRGAGDDLATRFSTPAPRLDMSKNERPG